jgi:medium-chain acyl-[acyl-carrier-protein] hydrolase
MPEPVWTDVFAVRVFETDANGTLAVRSFCDYLQEAAGNHARELGVSVEQLLDTGRTWVLSRLRARIERLPRNGEQVTVRTWPSGVDRLFALRDFAVSDSHGQRIASAISAWLVLDTRSKRPVRVQTVFAVPGPGDAPRALAESLEKLDGPESPFLEREITVRWSDLDVNRHVNNSRYAEWAVEGAVGNPSGTGTIARLDIDFLAETQHPGKVIVRTRRVSDSPARMSHAIVRAEDGAEAARARTEWRTS